MAPPEIYKIKKGSLAEKNDLRPGDAILSMNGKPLRDILDFELAASEREVTLMVLRSCCILKIVIENPSYESLGIVFDTSLFDGIKTCANKCVFCFIDQLPLGMRRDVYVKDDDYRLSFLYGNFVTLTNMGSEDVERIIGDRISPLYVSLHATDPLLRTHMLGRKKGDDSLGHLKRLTEAGIEVHIQIVLCPGLNDGEVLAKTIDDLANGYDNIESVGIVPVGLTGHREGLHELSAFSGQQAKALIDEVAVWQRKFEDEKGQAWVYLADEFYISAGEELPPLGHYDDFPQIENGIGLSRLFIDEARSAMEGLDQALPVRRLAVVTGTLFAPVLRRVIEELARTHKLNIDVIAVDNLFFGGYVNVTGLLAGSDIIAGVGAWLNEHERPDHLYLPDVLLNADGLMLDDSTPDMVAEKLGVSVKVVESSGAGFVDSLAG